MYRSVQIRYRQHISFRSDVRYKKLDRLLVSQIFETIMDG